MKTAFLFPGQGAEAPGMGGALPAREGPVRALLERASKALDLDLRAVIARGAPALARTEVCQPALAALCIGLAQELAKAGVVPHAVAGHSAGELAAFCAAGCLAPEEAVDLAVERGRLMAVAARAAPGGMAAVRLDARALPALLEATGLELGAHNGPDEFVLTGPRAALASLARRVPSVAVAAAGPWHSRAMAAAEAQWRQALLTVRWQRPAVPLVANATGEFVDAAFESARLGELLAGQLTRPVLWAATLRTLQEAGCSTFRLVGPGRVLRGLCRKNLGPSAHLFADDGQTLAEAAP